MNIGIVNEQPDETEILRQVVALKPEDRIMDPVVTLAGEVEHQGARTVPAGTCTKTSARARSAN